MATVMGLVIEKSETKRDARAKDRIAPTYFGHSLPRLVG